MMYTIHWSWILVALLRILIIVITLHKATSGMMRNTLGVPCASTFLSQFVLVRFYQSQ